MRVKLLLSIMLCAVIPAVGIWLGDSAEKSPASAHAKSAANQESAPVLRIGFAPEQNIFVQRKAYRALGDYLEKTLPARGDPPQKPSVQLVTACSYAGVLQDFREGKIDAAFMGSLSALVATDRHQGQVFLKSEGKTGLSTYSGVVFVLDSSPVKSFSDLAGKRLGAVRTTTGGAVFPLYLMTKEQMIDQPGAATPRAPILAWSGTHDDVIQEVVAGNLDAGAVKDLRLRAYQQEHPETKIRIIAESPRVPDNALVIRREIPEPDKKALVAVLLAMHDDPAARPTMDLLKVERYLPCAIDDYASLFDLLESLGPNWPTLNIEGSIPRRDRIVPVSSTTAVGD